MLQFNGVVDLKGFKIKQFVPWGSFEELKGFNCTALTVISGLLSGRGSADVGLAELRGSLTRVKKEKAYDGHIKVKCTNTLKKNRSMNSTLNDDDKKHDTEDDEEDTYSNETLHLIDDDSTYSDKELSYEELEDKYSLLYTKWIGLLELHQDLKDIFKKIKNKKMFLKEETMS
ncbi:hypothetical protein M9H77_31267 [Catharanthus roseus]|uniref:Uncharacterized protein n=1 Tax=Catharanthus roseus TaxID=4058 RepID=A0ACC0A1F6_CATRO|nr:hypothetical protein M9H77_31267 [Catharanthus roseus]